MDRAAGNHYPTSVNRGDCGARRCIDRCERLCGARDHEGATCRARAGEELPRKQTALPDKRYGAIVADPDGRLLQEKLRETGRVASTKRRGSADNVVAPEQLLAVERLVGTQQEYVRHEVAPSNHQGLFIRKRTLEEYWPRIARWMKEVD
jgi:hypothetical protein